VCFLNPLVAPLLHYAVTGSDGLDCAFSIYHLSLLMSSPLDTPLPVLDYPSSMLSFRAHTRTPSLTTSESESSSSGPVSVPPSPIRPNTSKQHPFKVQLPSLLDDGSSSLIHLPGSVNNHTLNNFTAIFCQSNILARSLRCLSAEDFRRLTSTCRNLRHLFHHVDLKETILTRFIPGYRSCLLSRDLQNFVDVHVTIHDLHLFRKSSLE
jgi:hypothetical protein